MDLSHMHILKLLEDYWEKYAINLNPYQTLQLVDWAYQYNCSLNKFACRDDALYNGFITLCNTYAIKIHSTLIQVVVNILRQEGRWDPLLNSQSQRSSMQLQNEIEIDRNGYYFTSAPRDLIKLFDEAFQVVRVKDIKELMLKMLHIYETITFQYQTGLKKFFNKERTPENFLPMEFVIAQCNNFFLFWQVFQDLINPLLQSRMTTEEQI